MATVATRLMTAEEFYAFANRPENAGQRLELDEGEVIELPSPKKFHGFVCGNVTIELGNYARQRGSGYVCSNDVGILVGREPDTVRGPDVAFFDDEQTYADMLAEEGYADLPPTFVAEVLSPSDRPSPVARKVTQYLRAGVKLVWVLDPERREVFVYRAGTELDVVASDGTLDGGDALPGLSVPVADLFRKPGEK